MSATRGVADVVKTAMPWQEGPGGRCHTTQDWMGGPGALGAP